MPPLPDRHLWSKAETQNQLELLLYFGSSSLAQSSITNELAWVSTGIDDNTYNGVAWARLDESQADEIITQQLDCFVTHNLPFLWYLGENSSPIDLDKRLEKRGCISLSEGVCMAMDLAHMNTRMKPLADLRVKRVQTPTELARWSAVYNQDSQQEALFKDLGLTGDKSLHHYLALLDGQPVGTSSAFWGTESVGLYHVEVLPEARQQGIGTALTVIPLLEARSAGYRLAVLGPSPESHNMYHRIGFELFPQYGKCYTIPMP